MAATLRTRPPLPQLAASTDRRQLGAKRAGVLEQSFYFLMSLLVAIVVLYGFSRTIETGLIHPPSPRPIVLYFHAAIFTAWVVFFIMQSALVITRNVRIQFGFALGAAIPIVGVRTAIAMGKLRLHEGRTDIAQFLILLRHGRVQRAFRTLDALAEESGIAPASDFDCYVLVDRCGFRAVSKHPDASSLVLRRR